MASINLTLFVLYLKTSGLIKNAFDNIWFSKYQYSFACIIAVFNVSLLYFGLDIVTVPIIQFASVVITGLLSGFEILAKPILQLLLLASSGVLVQTLLILMFSFLKERYDRINKLDEDITEVVDIADEEVADIADEEVADIADEEVVEGYDTVDTPKTDDKSNILKVNVATQCYTDLDDNMLFESDGIFESDDNI